MAAKTAKEDNPLAEERSGNVREVGNPAVWSLSSCKPGKPIHYIQLHPVITHPPFLPSRLWCRTTPGQLHGHVLAIGWPTTPPGQHSVPAQDHHQPDLHLHRLQTGRELHAQSHLHSVWHPLQRPAGDRDSGPQPAHRMGCGSGKGHGLQTHSHVHDSDRSDLQPPERKGHAHQTDQDPQSSGEPGRDNVSGLDRNL